MNNTLTAQDKARLFANGFNHVECRRAIDMLAAQILKSTDEAQIASWRITLAALDDRLRRLNATSKRIKAEYYQRAGIVG